jgi:phosphotriesterase-related protein
VIDPARVGRVQTVRGLVDPADLGPVMTHEHLLLDIRCLQQDAPPSLGEDFASRPVTPDIRADLVHHPITNLDDLLLDDEAVAADELARFKAAGGGTIVDTTSIGIGRDPLALRRISEKAGVHVTMGTGWYCYLCHPPEVAASTEEALADLMVAEILDGVGDTGVRAGHIGEIGCEIPTDLELKVLRAAARAQARTGAMLSIHQVHRPGDTETLHRLLDIVEEAGGSVRRTVLGHMDRTGAEPDLQESLLGRGVTIEYDLFGYEQSHSNWDREPPSDRQRILDFKRLIEAGFRDRLVAAQDICFKTMQVRYGGWGYAHILRRVVPGMRALGLSNDDVHAILVHNPARLLAFAAPEGATT